jgi:hypothetical protein
MNKFQHGNSTYRVSGYVGRDNEPVITGISRYQKPYKVKNLFGVYSMSRSNVENGGFWMSVPEKRWSAALKESAKSVLKGAA